MKNGNGRNPWRFAFLAGAVLGGISLAGKLAGKVLAERIVGSDAASIGIIGGADGPTAVFVASTQGPLSLEGQIALNLIVLAVCIFGYWKLKKKN